MHDSTSRILYILFILAFGRAGFVTQLFGLLGAHTAEVGSWNYSIGGLAFAYAYYLMHGWRCRSTR